MSRHKTWPKGGPRRSEAGVMGARSTGNTRAVPKTYGPNANVKEGSRGGAPFDPQSRYVPGNDDKYMFGGKPRRP